MRLSFSPHTTETRICGVPSTPLTRPSIIVSLRQKVCLPGLQCCLKINALYLGAQNRTEGYKPELILSVSCEINKAPSVKMGFKYLMLLHIVVAIGPNIKRSQAFRGLPKMTFNVKQLYFRCPNDTKSSGSRLNLTELMAPLSNKVDDVDATIDQLVRGVSTQEDPGLLGSLNELSNSSQALRDGVEAATDTSRIADQQDQMKRMVEKLETQVSRTGSLSERIKDKAGKQDCPTFTDDSLVAIDGSHPEDCDVVCKRLGSDCETYKNDTYKIQPEGAPEPFQVRCHMRADGKWTTIMHRDSGETSFFRPWLHYKYGFGTPGKEHWLGNDRIHWLTSQGNYSLLVTATKWNGEKREFNYQRFSVGPENTNYILRCVKSSDLSKTSSGLHRLHGLPFSTWDRDNDQKSDGNCAVLHKGALWYDNCHHDTNPTGLRIESSDVTGHMRWVDSGPIKAITLMIKK